MSRPLRIEFDTLDEFPLLYCKTWPRSPRGLAMIASPRPAVRARWRCAQNSNCAPQKRPVMGKVSERSELLLTQAGPPADRLERLANELVNNAETDMIARVGVSRTSA